MNQVGLVGRLTKDAALRQLSGNKSTTSFVLAINRNFRNNHGSVDADFVFCNAWGRLAERIVQYCGKGSLIGVNGRLQSRSYTNKDNVRIYTMEVVVEDVRFYALKSREAGSASIAEPAHQVQSDPEVEQFVLPEAEEEEKEIPVTF